MMNTKILLLILLLSPGMASIAQNNDSQGIAFLQGSFDEAIEKAKNDNKLLFIDFYTQWCGPCKLMDKNVFTLPEVGSFYNSNFVSLKIDAEHGEGINLKNKYGVQVFPTYLFIDPSSQEAIHKSTSRQEPQQFIETGRDALNPEMRSSTIEKEYQMGKRSPAFFRRYLPYLEKAHKREELRAAIDEYIQNPEVGLKDSLAFALFEKHIYGTETIEFKELMANRDKYVGHFGEERVNDKIRKEYASSLINVVRRGIYNPENYNEEDYLSVLKEFNDVSFSGKEAVLLEADLYNSLRKRDYAEADLKARKYLADPTINKEDKVGLMWGLMQFARYGLDNSEYKRYAINYVRYVAYNHSERDMASIHYFYAQLLEEIILNSDCKKDMVNDWFNELPEFGRTEYDLRDPNLKPKPQKK